MSDLRRKIEALAYRRLVIGDVEFCEQVLALAASERAAATAACAEVVTTCYRCHASLIAEDQPRCIDQCGFDDDIETEPLALDVAIRALSPEGWVGVRREDLEMVSDYLDDGYLRDPSVEHEDEGKRAETIAAADRIRAALARGEGE